MSVSLERKPISMPEFWVGCIALASVALIAFGGLRVTRPQNALPAPARYASVSIQPSEVSAKLPVEPPRAVFDAAEATPDVRSPEIRPSTGGAMPIASQSAEAPRPVAADRPAAPAAGDPVGLRTQQPGTEADSQVLTDAVWAPPLSNFRDSRLASQRRNVPDPPGAGADSTFVGGWTEDSRMCRSGRKAPLVISSRVAKTASGECNFGSVAREAANRWRVTATCAAEGKSWRANITLKLAEPNLTWSSERGTVTYVRCKR